MKKMILKSTLAVVAVTASCLGAWKTYDAYGCVDNSLLMQNIEALAQDPDGNGDSNGDPGSGGRKWVVIWQDGRSGNCYLQKYGNTQTINGKKYVYVTSTLTNNTWHRCYMTSVLSTDPRVNQPQCVDKFCPPGESEGSYTGWPIIE